MPHRFPAAGPPRTGVAGHFAAATEQHDTTCVCDLTTMPTPARETSRRRQPTEAAGTHQALPRSIVIGLTVTASSRASTAAGPSLD